MSLLSCYKYFQIQFLKSMIPYTVVQNPISFLCWGYNSIQPHYFSFNQHFLASSSFLPQETQTYQSSTNTLKKTESSQNVQPEKIFSRSLTEEQKGQREEENQIQNIQFPFGKWTLEQDVKLKQLVENHRLKWKEVVKRMTGRTYQMCYSRYQRIKRGRRKNWSIVEEKKLIDLVNQTGRKWKEISKVLKGRTAKQIRQRYLNHLQPHISHKPWTTEEDEELLFLVKEHGRQWKIIESIMGNRSQNQLKNRYFGKLKEESHQL